MRSLHGLTRSDRDSAVSVESGCEDEYQMDAWNSMAWQREVT